MHRNHEFFVIHILTFHFEQGAAFIGAFLSAVFSYTTIYGNFGFSLFGLFLAIT
jgi:hypothetical protein